MKTLLYVPVVPERNRRKSNPPGKHDREQSGTLVRNRGAQKPEGCEAGWTNRGSEVVYKQDVQGSYPR